MSNYTQMDKLLFIDDSNAYRNNKNAVIGRAPWGAWWAAVYGVTQSRTRLK